MHAPIDWLPGRDAQLLSEERHGPPMHTLKLLVFAASEEAPPLSASGVRAELASRISELAPLRRRLVGGPAGVFKPAWIDEGEPDLEYHVQAATVTPPGGDRELGALVAELGQGALDRSRPLWRIWVVEGLGEGREAIALKMHHCLGDGAASSRLIASLLSPPPAALGVSLPEADGRPEHARARLGGAPTGRSTAQRRPSRGAMLAASLSELARTTLAAPGILRRSSRAMRALNALQRAEGLPLAKPFATAKTPWNESPSARRTFGFVSVRRSELRAVQEAQACTVTEVVLAVVAGALRTYLRDQRIADEPRLTASVPVSLRSVEEQVEWGNRVAPLFLELGTELADPLERLACAKSALSAVRSERAALDLEHWDELWELYPLVVGAHRIASGAIGRLLRRPTFNLIVSSVRGPSPSLGCGGASLSAIHTLGVLTNDLGLNVTTWSYGEQLSFGVTSCPEFVADVWKLVELLPQALAELASASASTASAPRSAGGRMTSTAPST
jgi:WS/DGAT/MGAT family acyltransferase